MKIRVFVYRHEGIKPQLPTLVEADVHQGTNPDNLLFRITCAVTEWVKAGSKTAKRIIGYAGDDFNIGDLSTCLYNPEQVGEDDDNSLVLQLKRYGVKNLVIDQLSEGNWTYDTPLISPIDDD